VRRFVDGLAALAMMSGCSFIGVRGPSTPPGKPCTTTSTAPIVDDVTGSVLTAFALGVFYLDSQCGNNVGCGLGTVLFGLPGAALAVTYFVSARYGYRRVGECRDGLEPAKPPVGELRVDPECLRQRGQQLKRAQEIADLDHRTKALLAIPECQPVPVQRPTPAEAVPSRVINTQPAPPVTRPADGQPAPQVTQPGPTP